MTYIFLSPQLCPTAQITPAPREASFQTTNLWGMFHIQTIALSKYECYFQEKVDIVFVHVILGGKRQTERKNMSNNSDDNTLGIFGMGFLRSYRIQWRLWLKWTVSLDAAYDIACYWYVETMRTVFLIYSNWHFRAIFGINSTSKLEGKVWNDWQGIHQV